MNDSQLIERLADTDLYRNDRPLPETMRPDIGLLEIARRTDMDTMERVEQIEVVKPPRHRRNGPLIAAAAFALVIIVGLAGALLTNTNEGTDPANPTTTAAPPTTTEAPPTTTEAPPTTLAGMPTTVRPAETGLARQQAESHHFLHRGDTGFQSKTGRQIGGAVVFAAGDMYVKRSGRAKGNHTRIKSIQFFHHIRQY